MPKDIKVPSIIATFDTDPAKEASWHFSLEKKTGGKIKQYGQIATLVDQQVKLINEQAACIEKIQADLGASERVIVWLYDKLQEAKKQASMQQVDYDVKDGSWQASVVEDKYGSCFDGVPHQWGVMNSKDGTKTYCAKCGTYYWLAKKTDEDEEDDSENQDCCGSDGYCCTGQHYDSVFDEDAHKEPDWDPEHASEYTGAVIPPDEKDEEYSPAKKLGKKLNEALELVEETIEYGVMTHADAVAEDDPCEECDETEESLAGRVTSNG